MRRYVFSKLLICILFISLVSSLTACGNRPDSNGSMKSEDGRKYGGLIEAETGETVHTVFFDLTVDSARKCSTYQFNDGLYMGDEGKTYLEVTLTITNTYDKDLPMSITDFTLDYSENSNTDVITGYGKSELGGKDFMDNIFTLKQGEIITKTILYIVDDRAEYLLCYKEYYEDKFTGDSYEIKMVPEVLEPAVTTEMTTEENSNEANMETVTEESQEENADTEAQNDESGEGEAEGADTGIDEE
ncbi:MAG: DUF4352 domain-containing protein [Lachnospiraceae bacterium]|nr:DUF4352 domain-containing protein [Lachnospiraceae bacterium]